VDVQDPWPGSHPGLPVRPHRLVVLLQRQRDEHDAVRRQHDRERELLELEIRHERKERRRAEEQARSLTRNRHDRNF